MNLNMEQAARDLAGLGFRGLDLYLAELIPAVEMAWADGEIQPNERAMLECYCESLVESLNRAAGASVFTLRRAFNLLELLLRRRLSAHERYRALRALSALAGPGPSGAARRQRMLEWAEAVGAVAGRPVWDTRELFWLQALERNLGERRAARSPG